MKRTILSFTATVLGLVALLSFKTHGTQIGPANAALPSAALPAGGATSSSAPPAPTTTSSGPPAPTPSSGPPAPTPNSSGTPTTPPPATVGPSASTAPKPAAAQTVLGTAVQTQYGVVQVKITLSGSKITDAGFAQLTADDGTSQEINSQAAPILLQQTLSAQSAKIDGVSGASYTSQGYEQSLQSALDKAGVH